MRVKIGPYIYFLGPYQIAEKILFWKDKDKDDSVHNFGEWLATNSKGEDSWLMKVCRRIHNKQKRKIKIKIDSYDSWSCDQTLSLIALPLIKQLKETKQGSALVDDEDVPEEIRSTAAKPKENEWDSDEFLHDRWDWTLSEIIWALEQHIDENAEEKFYDHSNVNPEDDLLKQVKAIKVDREGLDAFNARKQNGFRLLGVYWQNLWD